MVCTIPMEDIVKVFWSVCLLVWRQSCQDLAGRPASSTAVGCNDASTGL